MKSQIFAAAVLFAPILARHLPSRDESGKKFTARAGVPPIEFDDTIELEERNATVSAAGEHRGTFILHCEKGQAAIACNNACYDRNCQGGPKTLTRSAASSNSNRRRSGCNVRFGTGTSVCGNYLFALKFNQGLSNPSCDEWPPASTDSNGHAPSLRCIERSANTDAGDQLGPFLDSKSNPPGQMRTGDGPVKAGQTFDVDIDISKLDDKSKVPYCIENPDCTPDNHEFHLSHLADPPYGRLSVPYAYNKDNHYSVGGSHDIRQCQVNVHRKKIGSPMDYIIKYHISVFKINGDGSVGDKFAGLDGGYKGEPFKVKTPELVDDVLTITPGGNEIDSSLLFHHDSLSWKDDSEIIISPGQTRGYCGPGTDKDDFDCEFPCRF